MHPFVKDIRSRVRAHCGLPGICSAVIVAAAVGIVAAPASGADIRPPVELGAGIYLAPASMQANANGGEADEEGARRVTTAAASAPGERVVGGSKTSTARWPWQVSIGYVPVAPDNAFRNHSCGGTLVALRIVVTAAHCVTLGPSQNFRPPEEFQVVSGRTKLSGKAGQVHALADYYWFTNEAGEPLWNPETLEWDVVFLVLASSARQETIKIAGPGEEAVWAPGRRAFATGWGSTSAGTDAQIDVKQSDVLRQARIRMISDSDCDSVYGPIVVAEVMVCAGVRAGGVDVCSGDSGGPLVAPIAGGGYRLIGNTSFSDGCGLPRIPGVYGRLAADPVRSVLQEGIQAIAGVDVVGAGAAPSSAFGFGRRTHRPSTTSAAITVRVPGRGKILLHRTKRVRRAVVWAGEAGSVRVPVRPQFKTKRTMSSGKAGDRPRLRVQARVTYTPMGGAPRTESAGVWLVGRR